MTFSEDCETACLKSAISGHLWKIAQPSQRTVQTIVQKYSLPVLLAEILVNRGIAVENIAGFLNPTLKDFLIDPSLLKDMDKAVACIMDALKHNHSIAILGDYDVDGATSCALLYRFFRDVQALLPIVYIPDRLKEGYGPSMTAIDALINQGVKILITVDCGTTAFKALAYAQEQGLKVIVIDHHQPESILPTVFALINPNRLDENSPLTYLAAVGLCFLFIVALNRTLRIHQWYTPQRPEPDLFQYLDLVALGTVCDMVPLKELNRAFVHQGLKIISKRQNLGIRCLMDGAMVQQSPTPYHLGYLIGPRINAGSRMAESTNGYELLTTQDNIKAQQLALYLNDLNLQRRQLEQIMFQEALIQAQDQSHQAVIVVWAKNWAIGIIGIIAGRLKEMFKKPAFVISFEQTVGKGSARSILNVDIGAVIHQAKNLHLLQEGGGHAMAAGFSLMLENIENFCSFLNNHLSAIIKQNPPYIAIESIVHATALQVPFVRSLETLGPFGADNPQPRFVVKNMKIIKAEILKQQHLRCLLLSEDQCFVKAMAFQCINLPLGNFLLAHQGCLMHFAGILNVNTWNNREDVTLIIEDVAF